MRFSLLYRKIIKPVCTQFNWYSILFVFFFWSMYVWSNQALFLLDFKQRFITHNFQVNVHISFCIPTTISYRKVTPSNTLIIYSKANCRLFGVPTPVERKYPPVLTWCILKRILTPFPSDQIPYSHRLSVTHTRHDRIMYWTRAQCGSEHEIGFDVNEREQQKRKKKEIKKRQQARRGANAFGRASVMCGCGC